VDIQIYKQIDMQTDMEIESQRNGQTCRITDEKTDWLTANAKICRWINRQTGKQKIGKKKGWKERETGRWKERKRNRQMEREKGKQTNVKRERETV
jgi:hypothetical protein